MQAILLVGGFGTRLRPLTLTTPKQMLPVLHRPMIEHVVSGLGRHGVTRVVLALGYHDEAFRAAYPDGRCAGVELCCVVEAEPLDTAGAIRFAYAESGMAASGGTFLVANGDVITDLDVGEMLRFHRSVGAEATIHLIEVEDPSRYGVVVTDPGGRVGAFVEKPPPPAPSNWINAGTYLMESSVIERIEAGRRVSVEREVFPAMAEAGRLWALKRNTYWVDAGTPQTYLRVQLDLLDGRRGPAAAGVSPDASVDPGAVVERSLVMAGAVVDPGAVVERSVVMADAVVGAGSVVRGSAVHTGAVIEAGATVLDSVVGAGATVGQGARVTDGTLVGEGSAVASGGGPVRCQGSRGGLMATLVTGGAGYIGSHTVVALHDAGRDVVILDDFSNASRRSIDAIRSLTSPDLPVVEGDAGDPENLEAVFGKHRIDSVVHFAARKSVAESVSDPLGYYRSNLGSVISLAAAAIDRGVRRLVFSSSATVYGTTATLPVTEDSPTIPESPYGETKLMGERILADAATASEMTAVILRYFNPVGAHPSGLIGEDPSGEPTNLVPRIMQVAAGRRDRLDVFGADYATADGTAVRDYVHVMDLAEGHVAALDAEIAPDTSRIFNLGTGSGTTVLQVLAAASEVVGSPIPYKMAERRPGDIEASWADCTRARNELNWQARRSLAKMLADHWNFARHDGP